MRKLIGIPLAGLLLVLAATAVLAQTGAGAAVVNATVGPGSVLSDVLSDLVGDGTINQGQADAIIKAVDDERAERRAEREKLRAQMQAFLADGKLTAAEIAQLPEDHPLRSLDEYLEDGELSADELQNLRGFGRGGFGGRGHHGGAGFGPMGPMQNAPDGTTAPAS